MATAFFLCSHHRVENIQMASAQQKYLIKKTFFFSESFLQIDFSPINPSGHAVVLTILGCVASRAAETIGLGEQCFVLCRVVLCSEI